MNSLLENKLKNLPVKPGVYQFLNDKGKVLYVGKARNLKSRVRSYFHSKPGNAKTEALRKKNIWFWISCYRYGSWSPGFREQLNKGNKTKVQCRSERW